MSESSKTTAVVLLNLGGPESLADVRPFLYNLFSDRRIIRLGPSILQRPIAWWIAATRARKSRGYYRQIGGASPLNRITSEQCRALERELADSGDYRVYMAMRYWRPAAAETLAAINKAGIRRIIALTLYPHYSIATTGSSLIDLQESAEALGLDCEIQEIRQWPEEPHYIEALAERIIKAAGPKPQGTEVVYSAHSLPVKFIEEGDPYVDHLNLTIAALEERTKMKGHLCFQSRSGPVEWLAPSTPELLEKLASQGCKRLVMVPISFVSDHVETLCEIDIQYRQTAENLGMTLVRTPSLNTDPRFIQGLAHLVRSAAGGSVG